VVVHFSENLDKFSDAPFDGAVECKIKKLRPEIYIIKVEDTFLNKLKKPNNKVDVTKKTKPLVIGAIEVEEDRFIDVGTFAKEWRGAKKGNILLLYQDVRELKQSNKLEYEDGVPFNLEIPRKRFYNLTRPIDVSDLEITLMVQNNKIYISKNSIDNLVKVIAERKSSVGSSHKDEYLNNIANKGFDVGL
jgi:hypothetical protein